MGRRGWALVVAAALAGALLCGRWDEPEATSEGASGRRFELPRWDFRFFEPTVDLCLVLQDPEAEPVPMLPVTLLGQARTSDDDGKVCFEAVPFGEYDLGVPEGWRADRVFVWGETAWWTTVYPVCPGEAAVSFEDGVPAGGATLSVGPFPYGDTVTARLDDHGAVFVADRPCGRVRFGVLDDDVEFPDQVVEVFGRERVEIVLPDEAGAILEVIDPDGAPVVELSLDGADAEELAPGVFAVTAPGRVARIWLTAEGFEDRTVNVPLDEGAHRVTLEPVRGVLVTIVGQAPDWMRCTPRMWETGYPCEGAGTTWTCACPLADACLRLPQTVDGGVTFFREACVPDGATAFTLNRDEAPGTVIGRWTGPQPCGAGVSFGSQGSCDRDGRFVVGDLQSGPGALNIWAGSDSGAERKFTVAPGGTVDLGDVPPDDGVLFGDIYADFPLDGAILYGLPGKADLLADGSFTVSGLPDAAELHLTLRVPGWGAFRREARSGEMVVWDIRWTEDQLGLDPPELVDSGGE